MQERNPPAEPEKKHFNNNINIANQAIFIYLFIVKFYRAIWLREIKRIFTQNTRGLKVEEIEEN